MAKSTDNGVAHTILNQLSNGIWHSMVVMCNVKNVMGNENSVTFHFAKAKQKMNALKIILTPADEYEMIFYRIHGISCKEVKKIEHVYAEDLNRLFRDTTGLATSL